MPQAPLIRMHQGKNDRIRIHLLRHTLGSCRFVQLRQKDTARFRHQNDPRAQSIRIKCHANSPGGKISRWWPTQVPISRWRTTVRLNKIDGQTAGAKDHDLPAAKMRCGARTTYARSCLRRILVVRGLIPGTYVRIFEYVRSMS